MAVAWIFVSFYVPPPGRWIFPPLAVVAAYAGHRFAQCGARLEGRALVVINPLGRMTVGCEDIDVFRMERWGPFPSMGVAVKKHGGRQHIWGMQARNPAFVEGDKEMEEMIAELNEWLRTCSGAAAARPDP